jgi:hypothetical protein
MKKPFLFMAAFWLLTFVLAACGGSTAAPQVAAPALNAPQGDVPEVGGSGTTGGPAEAVAPTETLVDEQGAVTVSVTPLNVGQDAATLDFEVALNTHSVELSMDLSELATLSTDAGTAVTALAWDAPQGGHHVSGVLSFPIEIDGVSFLEGATTLILTLKDVDAPARTFSWRLQ